MNSTFEYGPIYLDSQENVEIYLDVSCPEDIAEEVDNGDDNRLLAYHRGLGFLLPRNYFLSGKLKIGNASVQISYETYVKLVEDANKYSW